LKKYILIDDRYFELKLIHIALTLPLSGKLPRYYAKAAAGSTLSHNCHFSNIIFNLLHT